MKKAKYRLVFKPAIYSILGHIPSHYEVKPLNLMAWLLRFRGLVWGLGLYNIPETVYWADRGFVKKIVFE